MNDIVHIQPSDRISQGPSQIQDIVLKVLTHCAGDTFPVTDNAFGRLAYINLGSVALPTYAGWICAYAGTDGGGLPVWRRIFHINSPPPTADDFTNLASAKQDVIDGPISSAVTGTFDPDVVLVTDAGGKLAVSAITKAQLSALAGILETATIQGQLDGKQPNIIASISEPGATVAPDDTVWLVYTP